MMYRTRLKRTLLVTWFAILSLNASNLLYADAPHSDDVYWQGGYHLAGPGAQIRCATQFNGSLVVGGTFETMHDVATGPIAQWDGSQWIGLNVGLPQVADIRSLVEYDAALFASGSFFDGTQSLNGIVKWDGIAWTMFAESEGLVLALEVYDGRLMAAGGFTSIGGVAVQRIAQWDGIAWSPLAGGLAGALGEPSFYVKSLLVYDSELIAAGKFGFADEEEAVNIAAWDGSSWTPLGAGVGVAQSTVDALAQFEGSLIAGGLFGTAGGNPANNIAAWDGTSWSALDLGIGGQIVQLALFQSELVAGGHFTSAGGLPVTGIARWDGESWSAFTGELTIDPVGMFSPLPYVSVLFPYDFELLVSGQFDNADGLFCGGFASWDGSNWNHPPGGSVGDGVKGIVHDFAEYDGQLIAGGGFTHAGALRVKDIAAWDGVEWSLLDGGTDPDFGYVNALEVFDGLLIAAGLFDSIGGVGAANVAAWDGNTWNAMAAGLPSAVHALAVFDGQLFAGGEFGIKSWDGVGWSEVGGLQFATIYSLVVHDSKLFAAGYLYLDNLDQINYHTIASWDGIEWVGISEGNSNIAGPLAVWNDYLIAAGPWAGSGSGLSYWDGSDWQSIPGYPADGSVGALWTHDEKLYVGRTAIEDLQAVEAVLEWDGCAWSQLGSGMLNDWHKSVRAFSSFGASLYIGGQFNVAGDKPSSSIAEWKKPSGLVMLPPFDASIDGLGMLPVCDEESVTIADTCGGATVSCERTSVGGVGCGGTPVPVVYTYTATDNCGNTVQCERTVTVNLPDCPIVAVVGLGASEASVGSHIAVPIAFGAVPSQISEIDLRLSYDPALVIVESASRSEALAGWETFDYSLETHDGGSGGIQHTVRLQATRGSGALVPVGEIMTLGLRIADDPSLVGQRVELRPVSVDCSDNLIRSESGTYAFAMAGLNPGCEETIAGTVIDNFEFDGMSIPVVSGSGCACSCHCDPVCDGVRSDVIDVISTINIAFREATRLTDSNSSCLHEPTDFDCSGGTDVLDVVRVVNVAFRGANTETEYCDPCP